MSAGAGRVRAERRNRGCRGQSFKAPRSQAAASPDCEHGSKGFPDMLAFVWEEAGGGRVGLGWDETGY